MKSFLSGAIKLIGKVVSIFVRVKVQPPELSTTPPFFHSPARLILQVGPSFFHASLIFSLGATVSMSNQPDGQPPDSESP